MNLVFTVEPWMTGLKNFVGGADRPNISAPWLVIRGGHLFLCATNGHLAVAVELLDYVDQVTNQIDDYAYIPPEVFSKPKTATLTGSRWLPEVEGVVGHTGQPPDVFSVIPKRRSKTGKAPVIWGGDAVYLKDIAEFFSRILKTMKSKTIEFHMGEDALTPILMTCEARDPNVIANCVLMPMRL